MKKQINFLVSDTNHLPEKVIAFFTKSGLQYIGTDDEKLTFRHPCSIFDTWTSNHLKWGSKISVVFSENLITANFWIDTDGQLNTREEENVWATFANNFKYFLEDSADLKVTNEKAINDAKKSRLVYIGWAISGALVGGVFAILISSWTGHKVTGYFAVPIMTTIFLTNFINYRKRKNAL